MTIKENIIIILSVSFLTAHQFLSDSAHWMKSTITRNMPQLTEDEMIVMLSDRSRAISSDSCHYYCCNSITAINMIQSDRNKKKIGITIINIAIQ